MNRHTVTFFVVLLTFSIVHIPTIAKSSQLRSPTYNSASAGYDMRVQRSEQSYFSQFSEYISSWVPGRSSQKTSNENKNEGGKKDDDEEDSDDEDSKNKSKNKEKGNEKKRKNKNGDNGKKEKNDRAEDSDEKREDDESNENKNKDEDESEDENEEEENENEADKNAEENDEEKDEESNKVTICHKPPGNPDNSHTITVGENAVDAHLDHGDHEGSCDK